MMIDINPFKKFLTSLSRVSPFTLEIWNGSQPLLSGKNGQERSTIKNDVKTLSVSIKENAAFQCGKLKDSTAVFGMPLKHDDVVIVPEVFGPEDDWTLYYQLVKEIGQVQSQQEKGSEWISWHEGAHLIVKNPDIWRAKNGVETGVNPRANVQRYVN